MATALHIIERAFSGIGVKPSESPLTASEVQDGIDTLNDILSEWSVSGILPQAEPIREPNDELVIPRHALGAVKAALKIRLAPEYDFPVTISLQKEADDTFNLLSASSLDLSVEFPSTLPTGSGNYDRIYDDQDFFPSDSVRNF